MATPLSGRTVVVTRARHQAEALGSLLEREGARVLFFPMIRIVPPDDPSPLQEAAAEVARSGSGPGAGPESGPRSGYDWIIFTSANAVPPFARALAAAGGAEPGRKASALGPAQILAVGPATAEALAEAGLPPDLVPERYVGEGVLEALEGAAGTLAGTRILLPRVVEARAMLPDELRARGATVRVVTAYRNVPESEGATELRRLLAAGAIDIVTFTSSSTVRSFAEQILPAELGGAAVAAIGPITAGTARELGLSVAIVAEPFTAPALVEACVAWADAQRG